jgi:NhaP-type Na+/H+ or K+/H+ antiporter
MMNISTVMILILLGGWLFSRLFKMIGLPPILGMVVFGVLGSVFLTQWVPPILWELTASLKSFALIVILLRAGLGISKGIMGKAGKTALFMAFIPCLLEALALIPALHYIFPLDWIQSAMTAFMISAVSPAVIVPSMLNLIEQGYGKKREVPSIVLAGASLDDIVAITLFSSFLAILTKTQQGWGRTIIELPLSVLGGVALGLVAGFMLVHFLKAYHEKIRATEKSLILLTLGMLMVQVGELLHIASLLCVMTIGFVILLKAEPIAHELSKKFAKLWIFAEIILFVLIGLSLDISVALDAGLRGLLVISWGLIFRMIGVFISTLGSDLNPRERLFCALAYLPKATVQAALGGVALSLGLPNGQLILALAVLSIVFTAPLGLFAIRIFGPKLLDVSDDFTP